MEKDVIEICLSTRKGLTKYIVSKRQGLDELARGGFNDWNHLSVRLREHEVGMEHFKNMTTWYQLRVRLGKNKTIDKVAQELYEKEKQHWRNVLSRIISIVKFLGKHNLAFPGTNERLYETSNENFLGLIEMLTKFDHVTQEHVKRITSNDAHYQYLGHKIQNELILLLAKTIKSEIIKKIKEAKYFSRILDCTHDISHKEQMSMILRFTSFSSNDVHVKESFLGFLNVNDTSDHGFFDTLQLELKSLDLDIDDVRGQEYDNSSNMKGKHQGVQKRLLHINRRAFYTPCGCHILNLVLCDMAETKNAKFTKRWQISKDNVTGLTPKTLLSTRWESHVDSVKAIRFQMQEIRKGLLVVWEVDLEPVAASEANSLANFELVKFEFLVSIVIWFEVLSHVNVVSKHLQTADMIVDVAIKEVETLIAYFEEYRENCFSNATKIDKEIAMDKDIDPNFPKRREIKRKRQFDENQNDVSQPSEE